MAWSCYPRLPTHNCSRDYFGHSGEAKTWEDLEDRAICNNAKFCPQGYDEEWINFSLLNEWLRKCDTDHEVCAQPLFAGRYRRPSWLIDVNRLCLVDGSLSVSSRYAALSYVWGPQPVEGYKTGVKDLGSLQQPGALKESNQNVRLAKTIRDAIVAVKKLGLRYLWADMLCIPQDDPNTKHGEIEKMGAIYSNAYVTLIVVAGANANPGLPGIRHHTKPRSPDLRSGNQLSRRDWHDRGWTFQEFLLSSRVIMFQPQSCIWSCDSHFWDELWGSHCFENVFPPLMVHYRQWKRKGPGPDIVQYLELVSDYNSRKLTYAKDVLDAFDGAISVLKLTFGNFLFGLPEIFFDAALLWQPELYLTRRIVRDSAIQLPSWSWMAWEGDLDKASWCSGRVCRNAQGDTRQVLFHAFDTVVSWSNGTRLNKWRINSSFTTYSSLASTDDESQLPGGWKYDKREKAFVNKRYQPGLARFAYPLPDVSQTLLRNGEEITPYLYGRTRRAWVTLEAPLEVTCYIIGGGQSCGLVQLHSDEDAQSLAGKRCEVISLSKCRIQPLPNLKILEILGSKCSHKDELDRALHAERKVNHHNYNYYNVMLIKRDGDVAFRQGLGWIVASIFEQLPTDVIDITLG